MKKHTTVVLSLITVFLLSLTLLPAAQASDLAPFAGQSGSLRIAGGTAHIQVMKEVAREIITFNPDIRISIAGGGSGLGIRQVGEGLIDIGNAGRYSTDQEIQKYQLVIFQWAVDGVAAIVHPDNPVRNLTGKQLQDIFSGAIRNWKEVGGGDHAINLYSRDASSGTRQVFWKKGLHKEEISQRANIVVSNGAMKTAIGHDPHGIGYVSVGHIDKTVAPVALDGVAPTLDNVRTGKYKVARGLYSLTRGTPHGLAALFLDYLYSKSGEEIIAAKGFIPVPRENR